jgi:uncharacterized membrane protein
MELVLVVVVLGAVLVAGPVAFILALVSRRDLARLESANRELAVRLAEVERVGTAAPSRIPRTPAAPAPGERPAVPPRPVDLESIVGGQWLTWLGVLTIFCGTAFFLAYDLGSHALSGPGQIAIGLAVGIAFIAAAFGLRARPAQRFLRLGLLGGGVALFYLAAYAAHGFHEILPLWLVYPCLLATAVIGAWLALRMDSLMVASLTLLGALATPLVLQTRDDASGLLFTYLFAVNLGAVLVAARRAWPLLPLTGFFGSVLLTAIWWEARYGLDRRAMALAGTGVLWALYAVLPLVSTHRPGFWGAARAVLVPLNALSFAGVLMLLLEPDLAAYRGAALLALAAVYLAGARAAGVRRPAPGVRMAQYTGILLLALAVPAQLDAGGVTLGWMLLGLILVWAGVTQPSPAHRVLGLLALGSASVRLVVFDAPRVLGDTPPSIPGANGEFLIGVLVVASVAACAGILHRRRDVLTDLERRLPTLLLLGAAFLLWWRISAETLGVFEARRAAGAASTGLGSLLTLSLVWAAYGGLCIGAGFATGWRPIRLFGVGVLGLLVLKVFLLDMQELERGYRIASFVGVGVLLLAISLLYQRERRA